MLSTPGHATEVPSAQGHDQYETEGEIPEPMVFDLVRRLGSHKGELEVNMLFRFQESIGIGDILYAPEIEYAALDGLAFELEFPMHGYKSESLKAATQLTLGYLGSSREIVHGIQLLGERFWRDKSTQIALLYLFGHRFSHDWSFFLMDGPRANIDSNTTFTPVLNATLFYNYSREIDLGLEINSLGAGVRLEELRIMPQLHLLFRQPPVISCYCSIASFINLND
jgi:hypothetical protein